MGPITVSVGWDRGGTCSRDSGRLGARSLQHCGHRWWRPQRDSNPRFGLERATSWASGRWGQQGRVRRLRSRPEHVSVAVLGRVSPNVVERPRCAEERFCTPPHEFLHGRAFRLCNVGNASQGWASAAASTRRGTRRPGDSRKIGMCAVTGQVARSRKRVGYVQLAEQTVEQDEIGYMTGSLDDRLERRPRSRHLQAGSQELLGARRERARIGVGDEHVGRFGGDVGHRRRDGTRRR